jgi:hypothetical protein
LLNFGLDFAPIFLRYTDHPPLVPNPSQQRRDRNT